MYEGWSIKDGNRTPEKMNLFFSPASFDFVALMQEWYCTLTSAPFSHVLLPILTFTPNWRWMSIPSFSLLYEIDGYLHAQQQCLALHFFRKASCLPDSFSEIDMLAKWIFWSDTSFLLLLPLHLANTESERPGECVLHGDSTGRKRKRGKAACYAHVADKFSLLHSAAAARRLSLCCWVSSLLTAPSSSHSFCDIIQEMVGSPVFPALWKFTVGWPSS